MERQNRDGADASGAVSYTSADLWDDINECIGQLCEHGSREAVCRTAYDGAAFDPGISRAIDQVRMNANARAAGVHAMQLCVIYMINNAMDLGRWTRCIEETYRVVSAMGFQQVNHVALIQRDGFDLNNPGLARALADAGAAVYLLSQHTRSGWILVTGYEERKLLSYYAVMAAGGLLPENQGVYTGSYNKLSLSENDFRRIRTHYVVCGLTARLLEPGERQFADEQLFSDFIGAWIGDNIQAESECDDVCKSLMRKIRPLLPDPNFASIMANSSSRVVDANIEKYTELNFEGDWLKTLLARFARRDAPAHGKYSPETILQDWRTQVEKTLESHPEYYCREVADYLRITLLQWLNGLVKALRCAAHTPARCDQKEPIAYAIARAEDCLKPYCNDIAAALLAGLCREAAELADDIYARVRVRDEIISRNRWLLSEDELKYDHQYAGTIMDQIASRSRVSIRPQNLENAHLYFGDGDDVADNWARLVNEQQQDLEDQRLRQQNQENSRVTSTIDILNGVNDSDFTRAVSAHLIDIGTRLTVDGGRIRLEERRVVYMCSRRLHLDDNGRKLPKEGDLCRKVQTDFDNLLEFTIYGLAMNGEDTPDPLAVLGLWGRTERFNDIPPARNADAPQEKAIGKEAEPAVDEESTCFELQGSSLRVRLPRIFAQEEGATANLKWVLSGYTANNTKAAPLERTQHVSGIDIIIPLGTIYGRCRIELTCSALKYRAVHEFVGQKVSRPLLYSKKRPALLNRQKRISVGDDAMTFEHWICKLEDDRVRSIEALVNLNPAGNPPFYYPVGDAGEWHIWLPKGSSGDFNLEAGDEAMVYLMQEKD